MNIGKQRPVKIRAGSEKSNPKQRKILIEVGSRESYIIAILARLICHRNTLHRAVVACTLNVKDIDQQSLLTSVSLMISPLLRHNFLLSSSTVFMFSIHTASTGPSKTYQRASSSWEDDPIRISDDKIPSVLFTILRRAKCCVYN